MIKKYLISTNIKETWPENEKDHLETLIKAINYLDRISNNIKEAKSFVTN